MSKKLRKASPCEADNCGAVTPNYGTANISVRLCQEHMRGLATGEMVMRLEIFKPQALTPRPGAGGRMREMEKDQALEAAKKVVTDWFREQWPNSDLDPHVDCDYKKLTKHIAKALATPPGA